MNVNKFLKTGKIVSTHGIKGELKAEAWCNSPYDLLEYPNLYFNESENLDIEFMRVHKNAVIFKLSGVNTLDDAQKYIGKILYVDRDDVELDGSFFIADLIRLSVFDAGDQNILYGKITEITSNGAHDVYHITDSNGKLRLFPAVEDMIVSTDIEQKKMFIRPLKGLFE